MSGDPEPLTIEADDGWPIAATLFRGSGDGPAVLVSGAAAVPQTFYVAIARHLVDAGAAAALTYDYRGIAQSAGDRSRWRSLRMKDWALRDMPAALDRLRGALPDAPIVGLGHSFGGQGLGLCERADAFARYATFASMSGYWRGLEDARNVWLRTQLLGRSVALATGAMPRWTGIGEPMPGGVFLDWARWIARPDYFFNDPDLPETARFADVHTPLLTIGATDDPWANPRATFDLMRRYTAADVREVWLAPAERGRIGHMGFFRRVHADLWSVAVDFLLHREWGEAEPLGTRAQAAVAVV